MKLPHVPGTPGESVGERVKLPPPTKRTIVSPLGVNVERGESGAVRLTLLISPYEHVVVDLSAEAKSVLLQGLTGGLVIP